MANRRARLGGSVLHVLGVVVLQSLSFRLESLAGVGALNTRDCAIRRLVDRQPNPLHTTFAAIPCRETAHGSRMTGFDAYSI